MRRSSILIGCGLGFALPLLAVAADEPKTGWSDSGELGYVATSGNADVSTLGLKNTLKYAWTNALFQFNVAAVRSKTNVVTDRFFVRQSSGVDLVEVEEDRVDAENYQVGARYDRNITKRVFWYAGAGWDRNVPAGVQNRYVVAGGAGIIWFDTDTTKWRTDSAVTWTNEQDVDDDPDRSDSFVGLRAGSDFEQKLGPSVVFTDKFIFDENLEDSPDWRIDWLNAVAVAMSKHLALKVSLKCLYDNRPALRSVKVFDNLDLDPQLEDTGRTRFDEVESTDTIFAVSLVVSF